MIELSETEVCDVVLVPPDRVICQIALSTGLVAMEEEDAQLFYELAQKRLQPLWTLLSQQIEDNPWMCQVREEQSCFRFSIIGVTNDEIQGLNRSFRNKDTATDVLTFTMTENSENIDLEGFPEVEWGEIYISVPWLKDTLRNNSFKNVESSQKLTLTILDRIVHGCLHLLGVHHDTMTDYNKVIAIQREIVYALV